MRGPDVRLALLQVIITVGIARELAADTPDSPANQVPPNRPGKGEASRKDDLAGFKLLKHKDPELRALGARLLADLGENAAPAIPDLIDLLGDEHVAEHDGLLFSQTVGNVASRALESIGPRAVPALAEAIIARPEKALRIAAASTLVELLVKSDQKPLILQRLDGAAADPDEAMRRVAVKGLGKMGPMAKPALAHLIEIVKGDLSESVRFEAVTSLGLIDLRGEMVIPPLIDALKDRSADVSFAAAQLLGKFGSLAKSAVPALNAALDDPRERHLTLAPDVAVMRALRGDVAEALGCIGIEANAAIPALRKAVAKDRNPEVRVSSALALSRIDPNDHGALSAIIRELELKGEGTWGREAAVKALAKLGTKARAAVPALLRSAANDEPSIRSLAVGALAAIGDRTVIPSLQGLLEDKDQFVREAARESLEKLSDAEE
jgi:HEAT repeat protein